MYHIILPLNLPVIPFINFRNMYSHVTAQIPLPRSQNCVSMQFCETCMYCIGSVCCLANGKITRNFYKSMVYFERSRAAK